VSGLSAYDHARKEHLPSSEERQQQSKITKAIFVGTGMELIRRMWQTIY